MLSISDNKYNYFQSKYISSFILKSTKNYRPMKTSVTITQVQIKENIQSNNRLELFNHLTFLTIDLRLFTFLTFKILQIKMKKNICKEKVVFHLFINFCTKFLGFFSYLMFYFDLKTHMRSMQ